MSNPSVCAVMLTRDRHEYAWRALKCWDSQTYENKRLFILDTGDESAGYFGDYDFVRHEWASLSLQSWVIGKLRNTANERSGYSDIIIHWDDDDWSHPNRISEQVSLLQVSGVDCVGYREMLFWEGVQTNWIPDPSDLSRTVKVEYPGEAWIWSDGDNRSCAGTSLCYWRKAWEVHPFREKNGANPRERGEDREFIREVSSRGYNSFGPPLEIPSDVVGKYDGYDPRLIARIHSGNAKHYTVRNAPWWKRAAEWDVVARREME